MNDKKFLGICILISSIILAGAIIWNANSTSKIGRYQMQSVNIPGFDTYFLVIDTITGEVKSQDGLTLSKK